MPLGFYGDMAFKCCLKKYYILYTISSSQSWIYNMFIYNFISALDSKAPKAEDIEEEDDDVPGMDH